jgi:hypothetical protein
MLEAPRVTQDGMPNAQRSGRAGKMKLTVLRVVALALLLPASSTSAQHSGAPGGTPRKQCLSDDDRGLIAKLKALTRPTTEKDPPPPFDPDYFIGTWVLEWDAPESPLGPEGMHTGSVTFKHVDGCFYEGELTGKSSGGAYKTQIQIMYDPAAKYLVWIETDSRGFTTFRPGTIGADSGGYFTHYFETQGFTAGGKNVHLKGSTFIASPSNFRVRPSISIDGEPYMNFGQIWFRKQAQPPAAAR